MGSTTPPLSRLTSPFHLSYCQQCLASPLATLCHQSCCREFGGGGRSCLCFVAVCFEEWLSVAGGEEEEEEEKKEQEDAAMAVWAPVTAARLPAAVRGEMKGEAFGCLGSSAITNHSSLSPLKREGGLPEGFLEAGVEPHNAKICQFSTLKYVQRGGQAVQSAHGPGSSQKENPEGPCCLYGSIQDFSPSVEGDVPKPR